MANTSVAIYRTIDALTQKQQVRNDLPFLVKHYSTLKDLGITDNFIVDLFRQGVLALTMEDIIDGLKQG
jgi:hypothetical protein